MSNKKLKMCFVTGAAGFIGSYCVNELLSQGYQVAGIDMMSLPESIARAPDDFFQAAISIDSLQNASAKYGLPISIIHCAGSGSVASSFSDPYVDYHANVTSTIEVLEFVRRSNKSISVVIPSSAAVYGSVAESPLREDGQTNPVSPYGVHKRMAEDLAVHYGRFYKVSSAVIRLFSVYGPGLRKQILWDACVKAAKGEYTFAGEGSEIRDFIHVSDAARLLVEAMRRAGPSCPIANGGTGIGTSISAMLELLGDNWKSPLKPLFSGGERPGDPRSYIADISMIQSWGFKPSITIENGLKDYMEWFTREINYG
ncbi:MAG: NAD-dependent epimerase/dehydratase family protein [Spirochaetota bacterium]